MVGIGDMHSYQLGPRYEKRLYIEGIYDIIVAIVNKMETFKEKKNVLFILKAQNKQHFDC